jgi:hypothetical protein
VAEPRRSRRARIADALIWGALLGASSGAVLGAEVDGVGAAAGAAAGAVVMASVETGVRITGRWEQQPPLWSRILASALLMALLGSALGLAGADAPAAAVVSGAVAGLLGLRPLKLLLGPLRESGSSPRSTASRGRRSIPRAWIRSSASSTSIRAASRCRSCRSGDRG